MKPLVRAGLIGSILLPAAFLPAVDVDVAQPPGTPLDWTRELPAATSRNRGMTWTGGETPGGTGVVDEPCDVAIPDAFGLVRILTLDLPSHLMWANPRPSMTEETGSRTSRPYPPAATRMTHWVCMAPLLRGMLHPAQMTEAELIQHLVEIGEPARAAAAQAAEDPFLKALAEKVLREIPALPEERPAPKKGAAPAEEMLLRFVLEELASDEPANPAMTFGYRLILMGPDAFPALKAYASDAKVHPLARRNAVSALGLCGVEGAIQTALDAHDRADDDPVARIRALRLLARSRHHAAVPTLIKALKRAKEPVRKAPYLYALGMIGDEAAFDAVVAHVKSGESAEIWWSAVPALARLELSRERDRKEAVSVARHLWQAIHDKNIVPDPPVDPGMDRHPDVPDKAGLRAEILSQMCLLTMAAHGDEKARDEVFAILEKKRAGAQGQLSKVCASDSMGSFHGPTQYLVLDVLKVLGDRGRAALEHVALDVTAEPLLRVHALHAMSGVEALLRRLAAAEADPPAVGNIPVPAALRIYALRRLGRTNDPEAGAIARKIVENPQPTAEWGYLAITALDVLASRKEATPDLLAGLLGKVPIRKMEAPGRPAPHPMYRAASMIDELVRRAVEGRETEPLLVRILDFILREQLNPRLDREKDGATVRMYLDQIRQHKNEPARVALFEQIIEQTLFGHGGDFMNMLNRELDPPVVAAILIALGRTGQPDAVKKLAEWLSDPLNPARAEACIGLGAANRVEGTAALAGALEDEDGFVRYCAYRALRQITGHDHFCDWIYGSKEARAAAVASYRQETGGK